MSPIDPDDFESVEEAVNAADDELSASRRDLEALADEKGRDLAVIATVGAQVAIASQLQALRLTIAATGGDLARAAGKAAKR